MASFMLKHQQTIKVANTQEKYTENSMQRVMKSKIQIRQKNIKRPQPFIVQGQVCWGHFDELAQEYFNKLNTSYKKHQAWLH